LKNSLLLFVTILLQDILTPATRFDKHVFEWSLLFECAVNFTRLKDILKSSDGSNILGIRFVLLKTGKTTMDSEQKKKFNRNLLVFTCLAVILITLIRIPFFNPLFYEGDDTAIASGIQCWLSGESFRSTPLYRYNFQFGAYWAIYFLCKVTGQNALMGFYLLVFIMGSVFCASISGWFVATTRSRWWLILPTSLLVLAVPEILISSTLYPNTSILSIGLVSGGLFILSFNYQKNKMIQLVAAGIVLGFSMTCRLDAVISFLPVLFLTSGMSDQFNLLQMLKKSVIVYVSAFAIWLMGAFLANINFSELYQSIVIHSELYHGSMKDAKSIFLSGMPLNMVLVFCLVLIFFLFTNRSQKGVLLIASFGIPTLINLYHLTTPKYLLSLYTAMTLLVIMTVISLISATSWIKKSVAVLIILILTLHLWTGKSYDPETKTLKWGVLNNPAVLAVAGHDGARPDGSVLRYLNNVGDGPFYGTQMHYRAFSKSVRDDNKSYGQIAMDWGDWGLIRYCYAIDADGYQRHGEYPPWAAYPANETFTIGTSSLTFYLYYGDETKAELYSDSDNYDVLIIPEHLITEDDLINIYTEWEIVDKINHRAFLTRRKSVIMPSLID